jgi:hypothetical protein
VEDVDDDTGGGVVDELVDVVSEVVVVLDEEDGGGVLEVLDDEVELNEVVEDVVTGFVVVLDEVVLVEVADLEVVVFPQGGGIPPEVFKVALPGESGRPGPTYDVELL